MKSGYLRQGGGRRSWRSELLIAAKENKDYLSTKHHNTKSTSYDVCDKRIPSYFIL